MQKISLRFVSDDGLGAWGWDMPWLLAYPSRRGVVLCSPLLCSPLLAVLCRALLCRALLCGVLCAARAQFGLTAEPSMTIKHMPEGVGFSVWIASDGIWCVLARACACVPACARA